MRKSAFQIDDGPVYIGYTNGDRWNGWATPYFTLEEAQKVQADFSQGVDFPMLYDVNKDEFRIQYDDDEPYIWRGEDIQTVDGIKHLYGIGAYSHIWDEVEEADKRYLAQNISELMDEYQDEWDEDEAIKLFIAQFADMELFVKAHAIMENAWIGPDIAYTKLAELLLY